MTFLSPAGFSKPAGDTFFREASPDFRTRYGFLTASVQAGRLAVWYGSHASWFPVIRIT
jgi:hypothetical protein